MNVLILTLIILSVILWGWALYDINISRLRGDRLQPLWLMLIVVFPSIGPLIYFRVKRRTLVNGGVREKLKAPSFRN